MSADNNINACDLYRQLLVNVVTQVGYGNDFVNAQRLQGFDGVLSTCLVILEGDVVAR
ncbi:hypothetical protein D3C80_2241130 [compost metagenome]